MAIEAVAVSQAPEAGRRRKGSRNEIELPPHVKLSELELSSVARLVRLLRSPRSYWLPYYVQSLLELDSDGCDVSIEQAEQSLMDMKNYVNWFEHLEKWKARSPAFARHPAFTWLDDPEVPVADWSEDDFYRLVQSWRVTHPAPPPKQKIPIGYLESHKDDD